MSWLFASMAGFALGFCLLIVLLKAKRLGMAQGEDVYENDEQESKLAERRLERRIRNHGYDLWPVTCEAGTCELHALERGELVASAYGATRLEALRALDRALAGVHV